MLVQQSSLVLREPQRLKLQFAGTEDEVQEALRLRYRVFGEEMGARLKTAHLGIDRDMYDPYCEHLLVRDAATNEVVGTYRILRPEQAQRLGGYYSEEEFDMVRLEHLRERTVEVGRSCVHPDYRSGATIALLWSGLGEYMRRYGYGYLIGCASMSMGDGGHVAASVYRRLSETHMCPIEYRVQPRCPLPVGALNDALEVSVPPLIKGYLRVGAWVCGAPAWDPDFNTADLFILMPMERVRARYLKHLLRESV
jgi:putative hemolysin